MNKQNSDQKPNRSIPQRDIRPSGMTEPLTEAVTAPTRDELQDAVNMMSNDTQALLSQYRDNVNPNFNIKADPLYGYGLAPRDYYSAYGTPAERPEGYKPLYDYLEDAGIADYFDENISSQADADMVSRAFQIMQNANDYDRQQRLQQMAQNANNERLYGNALGQLLEQTPQGQNILSQIQRSRPLARERNITGPATPGFDDYWTLTGLEPANEALRR